MSEKTYLKGEPPSELFRLLKYVDQCMDNEQRDIERFRLDSLNQPLHIKAFHRHRAFTQIWHKISEMMSDREKKA